jgi:hypothetical protein
LSYRQLRRDLLAKLGVTSQRLSQRVQRIKRVLPMSPEEATCVLAHQEGLHLDRYLGEDKLSRIRQLIADLPAAPSGPARASPTKARPAKPRRFAQVAIGGNVKLSDPLLPSRVVDEAKLMARKVYPIMYVFENSVRELVQRAMRRAFGDDWWTARAPKKVRDKVAGRMQEEKGKAWHSKRGAHPIYYTDIDELKGIVGSNWEPFAPVFGDQSWFNHVVDQIAASRHVVAHSNPISSQDLKRLEVNFTDWENQVAHCLREGLL